MSVSYDELSALADNFLREHDPYFTKKGEKTGEITYPYLSKSQLKKRGRTEIPLSNLSNRQKQECPKFGDSHIFEEA